MLINEQNVKELLKTGDKTIPTITEELNLNDEFIVMDVIAELEFKNIVELKGFKLIYREDGGAIHLSIYGIKNEEDEND